MSLILTHLNEGNDKSEWNKVSSGSSSLKTIWRQWDRLEINNGILYRKSYSENDENHELQLIVPKEYRQTVFKHFHDIPSAGHLSPDKMICRIQKSFYWPAR